MFTLAAALFGALAVAHGAAVFSTAVPAPGSAVLSKPAWISVIADDATPITAATITVNGSPALPQITYPVGHWAWDDEQETDVWVVDDASIAKIQSYNRAWAMRAGTNTVVVTITSSAVPSSYTWTFDYVSGTTVGAVTPAADTVLPASPAAISASLISPSTSFSATMTVDGTVVPLTYTAATKTFTHTPTAAYSPGFHTVAFTARDTQVGVANKTWSFKVSPPMSTGYDCLSCHPSFGTAHPIAGCADCHTQPGAPVGQHGGDLVTVAGCMGDDVHNGVAECHQFDHGGEAGRGISPFTCAQCHSAANPNLPRHFEAATLSVALRTPTYGCFGGSCHTKDLVAEHGKYPAGAALKYQCDLCHAPTAPQRVKDAITTGNMECPTCHEHFHEE